MQPIDQVGGTILYTYTKMVIPVLMATGTRLRKADIDDFFYALPFVWQFVVLNIQPYWIRLFLYCGTLSGQSCSCFACETIPFVFKMTWVTIKVLWLVHRIGQVSVFRCKIVVVVAEIN